MRREDHQPDCPARAGDGSRCTCPPEALAQGLAKMTRNTELINLYGAACQDREELINMAEFILTKLSDGWTISRDLRLVALIEAALANIEKRKAKGGA